jgi:hypothetical protein
MYEIYNQFQRDIVRVFFLFQGSYSLREEQLRDGKIQLPLYQGAISNLRKCIHNVKVF